MSIKNMKSALRISIFLFAVALTGVAQSQVNNAALSSEPVNESKAEPGKQANTPSEAPKETTSSEPAKKMTAPLPQTQDDDKWQFQVTPYFWLAGITGDVGIGNLTADVSTGITDSSVHLNFGFMGAFEASKDRFVILTDLQYSDIGTTKATPGPGFSSVETSFKTFILDPEVGYRFVNNKEKRRFADVLGGVRYWHLRAKLDFDAGLLAARSASRSKNWVDAVVGLRGKAHLSKNIFISGKTDIGGGGAKFTYQLFGAFGYEFKERYALIVGYRDLKVNYDRDDFLFDMALHGPVFGFGIKF